MSDTVGVIVSSYRKTHGLVLKLAADLTDEQLAARKKAWAGPRGTIYASGSLWKYAQLVGETYKGAVTHPGGKAEKHVYADL